MSPASPMRHILHIAIILSGTLLVSAGTLFCQPRPSTAIYLADIVVDHNYIQIGKPVAITSSKGYNNQPSFMPDGRSLLLTSTGEDSQTDIYQYDISKSIIRRLTSTMESEYSPQSVPGEEYYSVVRVERDSTQRFWKYPLDTGAQFNLLPDLNNLGYYVWFGDSMIAAFLVEKDGRNTLRLFSFNAHSSVLLDSNIGRCLQRVPQGRGLSYVRKENDSTWNVTLLDLKNRSKIRLIQTPTGSEDYAWTPSGELIIGKGSRLLVARAPKEQGWSLLADFSTEGIHDITRIAINSSFDKIAFVARKIEQESK